jgi:hypothetical protein
MGLAIKALRLTALPGQLYSLGQSLTTLEIGNLGLGSLPTELERLIHLETLGAENNQLCAVPYQLGNLQRLTTLRLHSNPLRMLPLTLGKRHGVLEHFTVDPTERWADARGLSVIRLLHAHLTALPWTLHRHRCGYFGHRAHPVLLAVLLPGYRAAAELKTARLPTELWLHIFGHTTGSSFAPFA